MNEIREQYEKEFSKFLIEKINHAGGSLQLQQLFNLLQQLRFEVRDALGITQSGLMKFLRTHSTTFEIDQSKGSVTVANSSSLDIEHKVKNQNIDTKRISLTKIENGTGCVFKIFPEFAIIKAWSPMQTYIFFTPVEYGADENSLFTNLDLPMRTEVSFNAIHGHGDYEIEYRATKVWRTDSNSDDTRLKKTKAQTNEFTGEGVIKKLFPNIGFISVSGKENMSVYFYRVNCKDINIKLNDRVKFVAEYISDEWQATEITKKPKEKIVESSSHPQKCTETESKSTVPTSSNRIKDHSGKIYPYEKGAVIKFGENYSELADGNLCDFYLYSFKVMKADIPNEFSEGDDIKFDAIKSKDSPGWKAVLAWVGDKPHITDKDKKCYEEIDKHFEDPSEKTSAVSSERSTASSEARKFNNNKNDSSISKERKLNSKRFGSPNRRNLNTFSKQHQNSNIVDRKMVSQNSSQNNFKHNKNEGKYMQMNKKPINKYKHKGELPRFTEKNSADENMYISKNTYSDALESGGSFSEENNELQDVSRFPRKFLEEDEQYSMEPSQSKCTENNVKDENYRNHKSKEVTSTNIKTSVKKRAKIKRFEDIDGKIVQLFSKFAMIKSNDQTKRIESILNVFYKDGQSVEDNEIIDLKEVFSVGDSVTFNGFEIRDDFGETHQAVTMAWIGIKPTASEMTPEEFILENNLQVTLSDDFDDESESEKESSDASRSPSPDEIYELVMENSMNERLDFVTESKESTSKYNSQDTITNEFDYKYESEENDFDSSRSPSPRLICELDIENSLNERLTDEHSFSKSQIDNTDQELLSSVQHESLPDKIFKKLQNYGFTSSEPEEGLNVVQEIIDLVLKDSNIEEDSCASNNIACAAKNDNKTMCPSCGQRSKPLNKKGVTTKDSGTQTIVTGEIVLTSIFPDH